MHGSRRLESEVKSRKSSAGIHIESVRLSENSPKILLDPI